MKGHLIEKGETSQGEAETVHVRGNHHLRYGKGTSIHWKGMPTIQKGYDSPVFWKTLKKKLTEDLKTMFIWVICIHAYNLSVHNVPNTHMTYGNIVHLTRWIERCISVVIHQPLSSYHLKSPSKKISRPRNFPAFAQEFQFVLSSVCQSTVSSGLTCIPLQFVCLSWRPLLSLFPGKSKFHLDEHCKFLIP